MIWFATGNNSDVSFFTLKMDGREFDEVYPVSAKQYISDVWVNKIVKSYQNGKWVDWWDGTLYDSGNQLINITGGWKSIDNGTALTASFDAEQITISSRSGNGYDCALYTNNKVNVTHYSKMYAIVDNMVFPISYNNQGVRVGLTSQNTEKFPDAYAVAMANGSSQGSNTVIVDISDISGEFYPFL